MNANKREMMSGIFFQVKSISLFKLFVIIIVFLGTNANTNGNFYREITTNFYPQNKGTISNHTVESDIECALFCSRLDDCFGFGFRSEIMKKEEIMNCQLVKCYEAVNIHGIHYSGSALWTFFQTITLYGSKENPGRSCEDILMKRCRDDISDGVYWITVGTNIDQPFPVYCDMENGGWTLVFKTIAGESEVIGNIWKDSLTYEESSLEALNKRNSFKKYYKNRILQNWTMFNPIEVRMVLYSQTKEQVVLKFNASGTSKMDWFRVHRLQHSPWQDVLSTTKDYFSINAFCSQGRCRSFYINRNHGGCENDAGWLMIGGLTGCGWENRFPENCFLYSNSGTYANWNHYDKIGTAEVFAVYLR
ncbi:uncharacterized protein LOC114526389 [Dendronephthya gigantea]|uniref:uncharacterized protein LOC114526389 n=1 Tax=Dendronephthya gigantea TaxID=151771 RepID=UPI0010693398|nr:uncharacterized protein LOC114526389 [Dendronephthya gigantea]